MAVTAAFFIFFGLKVEYDEDLTQLLPNTDSESTLAFGNLRVKDKIFLQFTSRDSLLDTYTLGEYVDEFVEALVARDSVSGRIANVLYRLDADMAVNALYFALDNVPSFVDTSCYESFDRLMDPAVFDSQMSRNCDIVMNDWTGSATKMVANDPFAFRYALLQSVTGKPADSTEGLDMSSLLGGSGMGFKLIDGHLFCADSTEALVFIAPDVTAFDTKNSGFLVKDIESEIRSFESAHPDVRILYHGAPVRSVYNSRQIKKDLLLTVGLSILVILLVICLCYRSISILWQLLVPVVYGSFFSLCCIWFIKGSMSFMALGIGAIVLGVALSYCLHVLTHYRFVGDAEKMLKDESVPVVLGCLTTVGAFLGLLLTKSDLLRDFGIFASLALVGNTLYALVFLPHFLGRKDLSKNEKAFCAISRLNDYPYDRSVPLLVAVVAIIAAGCIFAHRVRFDSNLQNLNYNEPEVYDAEQVYQQKNTGGKTGMYYAATADNLDDAIVYDREVVKVLDSLQGEGVLQTSGSTVDKLFIPMAEQKSRIDAWKAYWSDDRIARARGLIDTYAGKYGLDPSLFDTFFAMVEGDYRPASLYDAGIIPESLLSNFIEQSHDGRWLVLNSVKMDQSDKKTVGDAVTSRPHALVVDPFYYTNDMIKVVHDDFNVTLAISSLFVFIVLLLSFRNLWCALIAFMPMFFSWYVVQGVMAIFGIEFNLFNIVISTFIFGIGVDYSIFVMQGLLAKARKEDEDMLSYHKTAIFFSAFVLLVVVASLLFATHPAIRSIGTSTLIGMVSTILITYTLQPLVFRLLLKVPYFRKGFKIK